jgi:ribokinase
MPAASPRHGRVVVVGSANIDHVMHLPRLPMVGETVSDGRYQLAWGGKGANQAVAAVRSGAPTALVAAVGDDPLSRSMVAEWAADGLDLRGLKRLADTPTGTAMVVVGAGGDNYLAVDRGANAKLLPTDLDPQVFAGAAVVVLQMEVPVATNLRAIAMARSVGARVLLNYAPTMELVEELLGVDLLVVNESEAAFLVGHQVSRSNAAEAAHALLLRGATAVAITLGGDGACLVDNSATTMVPPFPAKAVDTTAAGDTWCGAVAAALAAGQDLAAAAREGAAAAAITVSRHGAQVSIPRRDEVLRLLGA